jgi:hypothetical protein
MIMVGVAKIRITKHFGSSTIQQLVVDLEEAKSQLEYFWTKDGSSNIIVSVDGQALKSYDELLLITARDTYKNNAFIDVGLFLSNEGRKSIWSR